MIKMSKIIVIEAGHGGQDPGAVANGLREKDLTLYISKRIKKYLDDNYSGHKVLLTRTTDKFLTLSERANFANRNKADYFMSVHINAGGGTGYESFIHTSNSSGSRNAQNTIHDEAIKGMKATDRGKKRANFAVLRQTKMPAILPENLFIDRKEDAEKLSKYSFLNEVAKGHAVGIAKALGLKSTPGKTQSTPKKSTPAKKQNTPKKNTNNTVKEIQRWIGTTADGIPGPNTHRALVRKFQTELNRQYNAGLSVDGVWGPKTRAAAVTIRYGASGNLTRVLQAALYLKGYTSVGSIDGVYGNKTKTALGNFQAANRLKVDFIAGKATFAKLFG